MTRRRIWQITHAVAVCLGVLAAVCLLVPRFVREQKPKNVLAAMSYSDILHLCEASDSSPQAQLASFAEMGVGAIILQEQELGSTVDSPEQLVRAAGLRVIPCNVSADAIPEDIPFYLAYAGVPSSDLAGVCEVLEQRSLPLALIENAEQTGYYQADVFSDFQGLRIKGYRLWDFRAQSYGDLGYEGSEEIVNTLFRSTAERAQTLLWTTPFFHDGVIVTENEEYRLMFEHLFARLDTYHYTVSSSASTVAPYDVSTPLLVLAVWGIFAAGIALLTHTEKLQGFGMIVSIAALPCLIALALYNAYLLQLIGALAAAVVAPCWSVWWMITALRRVQLEQPGTLDLLKQILRALICSFVVALLGGTMVAAIFADSKFALGLAIFRGVKLSQILPLFFTTLCVFWVFYHEKGRSLMGDIKEILKGFRRHALLKCLLIGGVLSIALIVFIVRTGNVSFSLPDIELRFRSFLENVLYARPRSKEFLIAYPAFFVLFWAAARNLKNLILPFSVLAAIGFESVANTFCHGHAPYFLSLIRADNALLLGTLIALVVFAAAEAVWASWHHRIASKNAATEKEPTQI
ncbi:MAG: hypothetical protein IJC93_07560 [Clostridia bacterium]|nr:hypothetical protein [Clostridia bacterium]